MLKYHSTYIGFREIPDEISLCINITNCQNNCKGCHSPHLRKDIGTPLTYVELKRLIRENEGVTCVCFMGEGKEPWEIERLIRAIRDEVDVKWALYSGSEAEGFLPDNKLSISVLNYLKLGPYKEECGPLDCPTTNQKLFKLLKNSVEEIIMYKTNKENEIKDSN